MSLENDKGPLFLGIFAAGTTIAILTTALRFWVRARILRRLGPDDWIMLSSLVGRGLFSLKPKTVDKRMNLEQHGQRRPMRSEKG